MRKWLIPIVVVILGLLLGGWQVVRKHDSEYKYNHPLDFDYRVAKKIRGEVSKQGDKLVSQLGPFEDEYNLMHSLVFKFMNQVVREFPGRVIDTSVLEKSGGLGRFKRGKTYDDGQADALNRREGDYLINIADISSPETIERFWEIAKSIFEPAGFKGGDWLPPRKLTSGYIRFDWFFGKPSGISDPHITWNNRSEIHISGEKMLVVAFTTDTRLPKAALAKYRAAAASTTPTANSSH